ncbi:uncharacterized protein MELLADRAFT_101296 [Melampsora larici-populina 98AG31]|uniref:Uncharacterized protein n=1 Tax=Melampsora larici-populina (strain 98AG31 / pathotype 3-4-7) TaxID=747676 RepID=F4R498_MELLP|nr:uncharacterized protein MELLADRAFT_101296 [Melampsora larici-populina 98AG31]EGG13036.1 hypothetical protein MELLADRAFT_101296 [Melampsora larici-populina 98AG31]
MSPSSSTNEKVSIRTFGLSSPFAYPAESGSSIGRKVSAQKKNHDGRYLDGSCAPVSKLAQDSNSLQSPFSSPVSKRARGSSRHLAELSPERTTVYSTPVRYHLPTRMRVIPKPEISCFESDDEDNDNHLSVKKALKMASDALAWCTRRQANSLVTPKSFQHDNNKMREHQGAGDTDPKIRKHSADGKWRMGSDPRTLAHKVQWSGSTLNSVTEACTAPVPMCRETTGPNASKRLAPAMHSDLAGTEVKMGESTSQWIGWYGSNPLKSQMSHASIVGCPPFGLLVHEHAMYLSICWVDTTSTQLYRIYMITACRATHRHGPNPSTEFASKHEYGNTNGLDHLNQTIYPAFRAHEHEANGPLQCDL